MMSDTTHFNITNKPHLNNYAIIKMGMYLLLCSLFLVMSVSYADGLFDFQMKLAEKGNAEAQFKVGEMYETGFGVKEDKAEATDWIKKAANQGHETAGFKLLYWDIEKNGLNDANRGKYEALKLKANEGDSQAQYYLGKMYSRGVGVKKNSKTAINWLNKAALVGVLEAEREMTLVRENQQRWALEKQRRDEKKRAELKAKQKKQKAQQKKQAEAKARAEDEATKKDAAAASAAQSKASKQAATEKAKKEQLLAQQKAAKQREAEKQALIKKRETEKKQRKTQFESDPCSGKSAKFLSSCK